MIQQGGSLTNHPGLIDNRTSDIAVAAGINIPNNQDVIDATEQVQLEMKDACMLSGGHDVTHKQLKGHLENAYVVGNIFN